MTNSPATEDLRTCATVMAEDLYNLGFEGDDAYRIEDAFQFWGQSENRWPCSSDIRVMLASRRNQVIKADDPRLIGRSQDTPGGINEKIRRGEMDSPAKTLADELAGRVKDKEDKYTHDKNDPVAHQKYLDGLLEELETYGAEKLRQFNVNCASHKRHVESKAEHAENRRRA